MGKKNEKIVQTAGRNQLGEFAPMFAHLNDDVLFGEVWNEDALPTKTKCIITVVALMSSGITDSSLLYHLQNARNNGVSKKEILSAFGAHIFFDDQHIHADAASEFVASAVVPYRKGEDPRETRGTEETEVTGGTSGE